MNESVREMKNCGMKDDGMYVLMENRIECPVICMYDMGALNEIIINSLTLSLLLLLLLLYLPTVTLFRIHNIPSSSLPSSIFFLITFTIQITHCRIYNGRQQNRNKTKLGNP